ILAPSRALTIAALCLGVMRMKEQPLGTPPKTAKDAASRGASRYDRIIHRSWIKPLVVSLFSFALCISAAELGARVFWRVVYRVPFRDPALILHAFYPELQKVASVKPTHDDTFFDILLLGGSTLASGWGEVEHALREQMASHGYRKARIFNLAAAG